MLDAALESDIAAKAFAAEMRAKDKARPPNVPKSTIRMRRVRPTWQGASRLSGPPSASTSPSRSSTPAAPRSADLWRSQQFDLWEAARHGRSE
jgi:hypothetical protein